MGLFLWELTSKLKKKRFKLNYSSANWNTLKYTGFYNVLQDKVFGESLKALTTDQK